MIPPLTGESLIIANKGALGLKNRNDTSGWDTPGSLSFGGGMETAFWLISALVGQKKTAADPIKPKPKMTIPINPTILRPCPNLGSDASPRTAIVIAALISPAA